MVVVEYDNIRSQGDNQGAAVCGLQSSQPVLTWYGFRSFMQMPGRNRFQRKLSGTDLQDKIGCIHIQRDYML
jgi:hypothetical protein